IATLVQTPHVAVEVSTFTLAVLFRAGHGPDDLSEHEADSGAYGRSTENHGGRCPEGRQRHTKGSSPDAAADEGDDLGLHEGPAVTRLRSDRVALGPVAGNLLFLLALKWGHRERTRASTASDLREQKRNKDPLTNPLGTGAMHRSPPSFGLRYATALYI